ncbi:MAG: dihydroneopterin aldolase [Campylobacterota bacterium]|nr:dihydroneopterin aldolase [Campylobacterota bacterium]
MTIHIKSLQIDAIIGLLDFERELEQRVCVDLEAVYSYDKKTFIDYADLSELIENRIKNERYLLLEEALLDLKEKIGETYPAMETLKIKIAKPDILKNCTVALSQTWEIE